MRHINSQLLLHSGHLSPEHSCRTDWCRMHNTGTISILASVGSHSWSLALRLLASASLSTPDIPRHMPMMPSCSIRAAARAPGQWHVASWSHAELMQCKARLVW